MKQKKKNFIITGILLVILLIILLWVLYVLEWNIPTKVSQLEIGRPYIADQYIPTRCSHRFYVELRKDGTYSMIYDATRESQDAYDEVAEEPEKIFIEGRYEKRKDQFFLSIEQIIRVSFKDVQKAKQKEIYAISEYKGDAVEAESFNRYRMNLYLNRSNDYILAYPNLENNGYNEDGIFYTLYESDLDDIPDTTEEFLAQFTVIDDEDE